MKPEGKSSYWDAIRDENERKADRRDIEEIRANEPQRAATLEDARAYLDWLKQRYHGSLWPVLRGALVMAWWSPRVFVSDLLRVARFWLKVYADRGARWIRIFVRVFPIAIRHPRALLTVLNERRQ